MSQSFSPYHTLPLSVSFPLSVGAICNEETVWPNEMLAQVHIYQTISLGQWLGQQKAHECMQGATTVHKVIFSSSFFFFYIKTGWRQNERYGMSSASKEQS